VDENLPLTGVRVVDRTDGLGETTGRLLADLGADVIRVEPAAGAASRRREPVVDGVSLYYATHNANKRAVVADGDDLRRLVDSADIYLTGDASWLPEPRPGLVVVAITDYGLTGPYRDWQATEWTHLALGGVLARSGLPGRAPLLPPGCLAYESAAAQAAWAALVAYYAGTGDVVDVSVYEATARALDPGYGIGGSATGGVPAAAGPRFHVVDYKTNWLGPFDEPLTAAAYRPEAMDAAMGHSDYPLQALLYAAVLHRFLRWRLPGYDPERHLGEVLYLYVRGMCGPETPVVGGIPCGVFTWRAPVPLVEELSDLLAGRVAAR